MQAHHTQNKRDENSLISDLFNTYPRLCLALRNLILTEASKDASKDLQRLPKIISIIKKKFDFFPVDNRIVYERVAGVDAGSQWVPLASRWFAIIAALVYQLPKVKRFFIKPEAIKLSHSFSREKFHELVSIKRETMLFKTSVNFLNKNSSIDLLLIDGPLAFSNWWANKGERQDRLELITSINVLLNLCEKNGIAVAGVVKRANARYLINYLKLQQETTLSDAFVLLQTLESNERTDVFSPRKALKRTVRASPFMDQINCCIYSFYMRSSSNHLVPPIRIDIPEFMLNSVSNLASYCHSTAVNHGIPLPLVKADEEVRITKKFVEEIYWELIPRLEKNLGASSLVARMWGEFK
jgi:hypothetical protein